MPDHDVKTPGPDHPITVEINPNRVVVRLGGRVIAKTTRALTLREASYPAVYYIQRDNSDMAAFARSDTHTYLLTQRRGIVLRHSRKSGAVCGCDLDLRAPYEIVAVIKDHLVFYADHVDATTEQEKLSRSGRRLALGLSRRFCPWSA